MGFLDNVKAFVHSITTEDHYASYDSPYRDSVNNAGVMQNENSSQTRLNELHNASSASLVGESTDGTRQSPFVSYRPGLRSSNTNLNGSDVQLQNLSRNGQPPLPLIDSLWDRLEAWLEEEYPELYDSLNDGVTTADLNEFEKDLGCGSLPVEFRQLYKRCDGQFRGGKPTGLFMGLVFLDLESIVEEHAIWRKVAERLEKQQFLLQKQQQRKNEASPDAAETGSSKDINSRMDNLKLNNSFVANQRSIPPNAIQPFYSHRGWVPICRDYFGNQIALDVAPGPAGVWGQVIVFGRDYDTKLVVASNLQEFLFILINDLENGNFKIDESEINSSYGYLEASRNDDDFIGDEDEGQGELFFFDKDNEFGKSRTPLTYLEVLKRRTLKKHGVSNVESFLTTFVPQNPVRKAPVSQAGSATGSTADLPNTSSPMINLESSSKVDLPKETIIDDKEKPKAEVPATKTAEVAEPAKTDTVEAETTEAEAEATESTEVPKPEQKTPEEPEVSEEVSEATSTKPDSDLKSVDL